MIPARCALGWAIASAIALLVPRAIAQDAPKEEEPPPKFDAAYPGKAPKLNPGSYEPEFIYERVTYGFRKMPAWKDVFSVDERKGVVAYIKSSEFSP